MSINIIKFVVKTLGYEWAEHPLKLPVWTIKKKKSSSIFDQ